MPAQPFLAQPFLGKGVFLFTVLPVLAYVEDLRVAAVALMLLFEEKVEIV